MITSLLSLIPREATDHVDCCYFYDFYPTNIDHQFLHVRNNKRKHEKDENVKIISRMGKKQDIATEKSFLQKQHFRKMTEVNNIELK